MQRLSGDLDAYCGARFKVGGMCDLTPDAVTVASPTDQDLSQVPGPEAGIRVRERPSDL